MVTTIPLYHTIVYHTIPAILTLTISGLMNFDPVPLRILSNVEVGTHFHKQYSYIVCLRAISLQVVEAPKLVLSNLSHCCECQNSAHVSDHPLLIKMIKIGHSVLIGLYKFLHSKQ